MIGSIRILLVDDQTTVRQALQVLLEQQSDFQVVGSVGSGREAIEQVKLKKPDIVLIDIQMPEMDGITTTRFIMRRFKEAKVLVLSGYSNTAYLSDSLRAGAKGYLLKDTPASELASGIRSVHRGYTHIGPGLLETLMAQGGAEAILGLDQARIGSGAPLTAAMETAQPAQEELEELAEQDALLQQEFQPALLLKVVEQVVAQQAIAPVLTILKRHLTRDPDNLNALFLSGLISSHSPEHRSLSIQYLRSGFREGLQIPLPQDDLWAFYQAAAEIDPPESFSWLLQPDSPWQTEVGLVALCKEAANRFGEESVEYRSCLNLYRIKLMQAMSRDCLSLAPKIEHLQQRFSRLNQLLEQSFRSS